MSWFRRPRVLTIGLILVSALCTASCEAPGGLERGEGATKSDQPQVPFHDGEGKLPRSGVSSAADNAPSPESGLPFHQSHDPQNLPVGTLLTVRLKSGISTGNPDQNGNFDAIVDEPVIVGGKELVPLGASVSGRVESARASNLKRNHWYVRLTLDSIHLAGSQLPVQTSSLFVGESPERGNADQAERARDQVTTTPYSTPVVRLEKGRRLVFRLTEPAYIAASQTTQVQH